jgi:hypothetical protein
VQHPGRGRLCGRRLAGGIGGAALGWLVGPGIGAALGLGLDFGEGLSIYGLGLLSNGLVVGTFTLLGMAVDESGNTWGLGRAWGLMLGVGLGAIAQVFLTPLYGVLLFDDRAPATDAVTVLPYAAPTLGGGHLGVMGAF